MKTGVIKLTKKVLIDRSTTWPNAQDILEQSLRELCYQIKKLGAGFQSWEQVLKHRPELETPITSSVIPAIQAYLSDFANLDWKELKDFNDILEIYQIKFVNYTFKIIKGNFSDINSYKIAFFFSTDELTLLGQVDNKLLLAIGDKTKELAEKSTIDTFMLQLGNDVMITSFKDIT